MHYDTPDIRRFDPIAAQYVRVYPERWSPAGIGMRLEVLGCDWTGKAPPAQDALGGGHTMTWTGPEGTPIPSRSPTSHKPCRAVHHVLPPQVMGTTASGLGTISQGSRGLSFLKDDFSSPAQVSKINPNHTPPTQIQLDPNSSGQGAVAVDLGKEKKLS